MNVHDTVDVLKDTLLNTVVVSVGDCVSESGWPYIGVITELILLE